MFFRTASAVKPFIETIVVDDPSAVDLRRLLAANPVLVLAPSSSPKTAPSCPLNAVLPRCADAVDESLAPLTAPRAPCTLGFTQPTPAARPMFGALYNTGSQPCDVSFAKFETMFCQMSAFDVSRLRTQPVVIDNSDTQTPKATKPMVFDLAQSPTRACLPSHPLAPASQEDKQQTESFKALLKDVSTLAEDECILPRNTVTLVPGALIVFDNIRCAHMIKTCTDHSKLTQASFNLPNDPALERALYSACDHPLFRPSAPCNHEQRLDITAWRAVSQSELLKRVNGMFADEFYSKPGLYWGKINTSTTDVVESYGMCDGLPADLREVVTQREYARDAYIDADIIRSSDMMANLFETHKCARSLELRTHMLSSVDVASFPLGTQMDDSELYGMVRHYGMSLIAGPISKLMQFAIFCARAGHTFPALRAALFTHDAAGQEDLRPVQQLAEPGNADVQCFGSLESNYAGPFALSRHDRPNTFRAIDDVAQLHVVDDEGRDVAVGQQGELAVTMVARAAVPAVKVREGVLAKRVTESEVEYIGERPQDTFHDFTQTGKRVFWNEMVDAVSPTLKKAFNGAALFQLVIGSAHEVTLAIYAAKRAQEVIEEVEKAVVQGTTKVLDGCGVTDIKVRWVDYGDDLHRLPSYRLMTFVH